MKIFVIILLSFSSASLWSFDSNSWIKTPGNNTISYIDNDFNLYCKDKSTSVKKLIRWYFYKCYIIGEHSSTQNQFFIFNEENCELITFDNKVEFNDDLSKKGLLPRFYTRYYSDNWNTIIPSGHFLEEINKLLIIILVLSFTILLYLIGNRYKHLKSIGVIVLALFIMRVILDIFPQSI